MTLAYNKAKGRQAEADLVAWLRLHGLPYAERRRLAGTADRGDIAGWPGVVVEVKSGHTLDLPGWMRELDAEQENDGADVGLLVIRLRGQTDPAAWLAVQRLEQAVRVMREAGH